MHDPIEKLKAFIRCRSVSTDPAYASGMEDARAFLRDLLGGMGLAVETVSTGGEPVILARREGDPSWPHVIIYGHYDVQPADPFELWESEPFEPEVRGDRLYGRGAADNKGPLLVHLTALGELLEKHPDLPLRVSVMVEGEEEIGSPSFGTFLREQGPRLDGDFVLLSDTGNPSEDQVVITCGLRGIMTFEVEMIGPRTDLHSGLHGGVLRNPIQALAELIATLHDAEGRVAIDGFYDDVMPVEAWEREELKRLGVSEAAYREFLGISEFYTPPGYTPFEAIRFLPTLECNGIGGGYQGEGSKTIIPSRAFAKLSCRLVANQDPDKIAQLVEKTLRERCPSGVKMKVRMGHKGAPYVVVPPDRPNTPPDQNAALAEAFRAMDRAVSDVFGRPPVYAREGGSVPIIADIRRELGLDSLMLGLFLPEDNLHAPNESFHLGVMRRGIEVSRRVLGHLAGLPPA